MYPQRVVGSLIVDHRPKWTLHRGGTVTGNLILDDGVGDSPKIIFVGGSNNDAAQIYLDDVLAAEGSILIIRLPGNSGLSRVRIEDKNGTDLVDITDTGEVNLLTGSLSLTGGNLTVANGVFAATGSTHNFTVADAVNDAATTILELYHGLNMGVGEAGMGARILFELTNDDGDRESAGAIDVTWADPAADDEDAYFEFRLRTGGSVSPQLRIQNKAIRFPERTGDPANAADTGWLYTKDDGSGNTELYYEDESGNVAALTPPSAGGDPPENYRDGVLPYFCDDENLRVMRGTVEIEGTLYTEDEDTDFGLLDLLEADHYIGGVSQRGADKWLYIYVYNDADTGWAALFYDEPPLYPTCSETLVFEAMVNGNPAAAATAINYDNDTGEADLMAQDIVCIWTDATFSTWRGGWRLVSNNAGINQMTVEANNVDAADDDYITVVHGVPRYRKVGDTWYRCVGAVRLDDGQVMLPFYRKNLDGGVRYELIWYTILASGNATSYTTLDCSAYVPPYAIGVLTQMYVEDHSPQVAVMYIRPTGKTPMQYLYRAYYEGGGMGYFLILSPNQAFDYRVPIPGNTAKIWCAGWMEEL